MLKRKCFIACSLALVLLSFDLMTTHANAQTLPKPKGPVILSVSGRISQRNVGNSAEFDAEMLKAMPVSQITTRTPWHASAARFSGPALKTLLSTVGTQGTVLRLIALDRYEVSIPIEDVSGFGPVLALQMDDKELKVRDRGPVLLIYPFDSYPQINTEIYFGRSVWQLRQIIVK